MRSKEESTTRSASSAAPTVASTTPAALKAPRFMLSDHALPWLAPLLALLIVFAVFPFFYNVWLSFHEFVPRKRALEFAGTANWEKLFTDSRMWGALLITLMYTAFCLFVQLVLGLGIALLLDSDDPGFGFLRGVLTLTLVIPPAITGMMFLLLEDAQFGVFTYALQQLGILGTAPILGTSSTALMGVMIADIWQWTPFMVLIFLAGLRAMPTEPFESALIDGASNWQIFRRLTLPMLGKVIAIAVLIRGIDLFRTFDYVYVMTSGGPGTSTYTLSLYAWQQTFSFLNWGYGATISLFSLFVILIVANVFVALTKLRW
ncbi:MAG: carbohydrate ABC transporter permease [Granulosicoccus sp.]